MNYSDKLKWQKSHHDLALSYNLDYDTSSIWEVLATGEVLRELPFYIQEIGFTAANSNYYVARKGLESYMLCYITKGSIILNYDHNKYQITQNSIFSLDCTKEHKISLSKNTTRMECYFIHFFGDGAKKYMQYFNQMHASGIIELQPNNTILPAMQHLLNLYANHHRSILADYEACTALTNICFTLLNETKTKRNLIPSKIIEIRNTITERYMENITLESLATQYFYSKSYLQKQFKKYIGISPLEYLTQTRITEAKKLLRATNISITKISEQVGFHDSGYFIQVFRNEENVTPLKYRKQWKK